jgi:hypothetical protein
MNIAHCHRCIRAAGVKCAGRCACPVDGADVQAHADAGYCPLPKPKFGDGRVPLTWKSVGAGDTIAKVTSLLGIKPCGKCKERQQRANRAAPYAKPAGE